MKSIIVTGAARRGGAAIARRLHARGYHIIVHCRSSVQDAQTIVEEMNAARPNSATVWQSYLNSSIGIPPHVETVHGIVASASEYISHPFAEWQSRFDVDMQTHVEGHLAIIRHCQQALEKNQGAIVAITDISVERPTKGYVSYLIAKGALATAVRALAVDLAPNVRVNAVAPGPLDWPMNDAVSEERKARIIASTPLGRIGTFDELAKAVEFLLLDATFTTGCTLTVDGGRLNNLEN